MSLKVLLADDSMTAQNMARKILADSGYEVTTVSNGAAAVKKIAEVKPDLVILDIYMPGYTGLEVCERVRANLETTNMPVLLTVGKMEPYRPEDGARVRADGIIVKPFEATDLLAIVKKISEKFAPAKKAQAMYDDTIQMPSSAVEEFKDASEEDWKPAARVEVPSEMAITPAMEFNENPAGDTTTPITMDWAPSAPAMEPPATEFTPAIPMESAVPSSAAPAFTPFHSESSPGAITDSMPVYIEPEISAYAASPTFNVEAIEPTVAVPDVAPLQEIEFNAVPQARDVHVEPAADFEPTASIDHIHVADSAKDPALVTDVEELAKFTTGFGVANPEEVPVGTVTGNEPFFASEPAASEIPELVPENVFATSSIENMEVAEEAPATEPQAEATGFAAAESGFAGAEEPTAPAQETVDDFEARVAAAMSAFEHPLEETAHAEPEPAVVEQVDNFVADPEIVNPITAEPVQETASAWPEPEELPAPVAESRRMLDVNETMVLPAEAMLSLEAEMRKAMELKKAAMSTEPPSPSHEQVIESFTGEPFQESRSNETQRLDAFPKTSAEQFVEPEPEAVPHPGDHEFATALGAALNESHPDPIHQTEPEHVQASHVAAPALAMAAAAAIPAMEHWNGFGEEKLASAVQKAVERLQPQIIAEIVKALKGE